MISVIVPIYNAQAYLEDTVKSILGQTVRDLELILVDAESTDGSPDICHRAAEKDSRVRVLTTAHGGVSAARNTGIEASKGDILCFVDADDMLNPLFLATLRDYCSGKNEIAVATLSHNPACLTSDNSGHAKKITLTGLQAAEKSLYQQIILNSPCGKLFRRELFFNPPLRFRNGIRFEDLEIATPLLCRASRVTVIDRPLYFYRDNPGGFMNSNSDARMDCLKVTDDTVRWVTANQPTLTSAAISRQVSASFHIFRWISKHRPDLRQVAAQCFETIKRYRRSLLLNPDVRLKNKFGLLASFLGCRLLSTICRIS